MLKALGKRYNGFVTETPMTDFVASLSHTTYRYVVPVQETETIGYEICKRRKQSCLFRVGKSCSRWYLSATLAFNY